MAEKRGGARRVLSHYPSWNEKNMRTVPYGGPKKEHEAGKSFAGVWGELVWGRCHVPETRKKTSSKGDRGKFAKE